MIKAIIFDAGGVLHKNNSKYIHDDIKKTLRLTENNFRKPYNELICLLQIGKITEDKFWQNFIKVTKTKMQLPKGSLHAREYIKRFKINKNTLELVKLLKNKGYRLAVLSNTIKSHKDYNDKQKLYDKFNIKIFSNEVSLIKPNLAIYKLTLKKLKAKPKETVFIDDGKIYVNAARRIGLVGIIYRNYKQLIQELKKLSVKV